MHINVDLEDVFVGECGGKTKWSNISILNIILKPTRFAPCPNMLYFILQWWIIDLDSSLIKSKHNHVVFTLLFQYFIHSFPYWIIFLHFASQLMVVTCFLLTFIFAVTNLWVIFFVGHWGQFCSHWANYFFKWCEWASLTHYNNDTIYKYLSINTINK